MQKKDLENKLILWIDPSPERSALAYQRMSKEDRDRVIWCKFVFEAITVLEDYYYRLDKIFLDHDLGSPGVEVPFVSSDSGLRVVSWIEEATENVKASLRESTFILHGYNEVGIKLMFDRLTRCGMNVIIKPFGS